MTVYLLWALGAAVAWGSADFCAKKAAERLGFWATVWGMNAVGALALAIVWGAGGVHIPSSQLPLLIWLGVGNTVGGVLFYYALEYGPLVLVSPITAAYPVVSAVLAYVISGERLAALMALAVAGVIAGTLLASLSASRNTAGTHPRRRSALWAAAGGALVFGSVFYALAAHSAASGTTAPVLVFRFSGAGLLALPLLAGFRPPRGWFRSRWLWATGLLDSSAYIFFAEGARHLPVSVVSALSGLFTVWTLVLAVIFLRERLSWRQWLGVAFIIAAIALLALR
ncbi:MAG: EamA family transporter [Terriglobales bacterium]